MILSAAAFLQIVAAAPAVPDGGSETAAVRTVEYVFEVRAGDKTSRLAIREETGNGERTYVSRTENLEQFYRYDGQDRLTEWHFSNPGKNTGLTAKREGANIVVRGTLNGEAVEKTIGTGGEPWFQNSEFGLLPFARSPGKTLDFFAIDPDGIKKVSFRARKVAGESLVSRGRSVDTLRIKAHLPGPLSLIWSATYWYALPDITFIRYQASSGGGSPKTDITLLEINGP